MAAWKCVWTGITTSWCALARDSNTASSLTASARKSRAQNLSRIAVAVAFRSLRERPVWSRPPISSPRVCDRYRSYMRYTPRGVGSFRRGV
ncbi:hypothetical protein EES40_21600 [Streptomyces sp. ADI93-02]|nr:hypothetical protein EES40_21600 [Streptomyces sp. ADI93-02]